jgi:hypothetical protein
MKYAGCIVGQYPEVIFLVSIKHINKITGNGMWIGGAVSESNETVTIISL